MPHQPTTRVKRLNKEKLKTLKTLKVRYVSIYLKIMAKALSEIIIFLRRIINVVYKKNIKFGKNSKFWKSCYSQVVYFSTGRRVPFDG